MHTLKNNFIQAIKNGDTVQVESILKEDLELVNEKTEEGLSVLLLAKYYQKNDIVEVLLRHKTKFDLFEASATGRVNFLEKYLDKNPEQISIYANDGFSPLGLACFFGQLEAVQLLLRKGADVNQVSNNPMELAPIHSAVAARHFEIVKLLIEQGASINVQQIKGVTPLHAAAHNGLTNIVELLLKNGANPNIKMEDGTLPIDFARKDNYTKVITLLEAYQ